MEFPIFLSVLSVARLVCLSMAICLSLTARAGTAYDFELVNGGAVMASNGSDTGCPSVIRVPDWIAPAERANPAANYYLYYGNHHGSYIHMKWAATLAGPWTEFNLGKKYNGMERRGVFDTKADPTRASYAHVFSPDVHVDTVNHRIVMYYHGKNQPATRTPNGTQVLARHSNFVATSSNGLNFNDPLYAGGQAAHGPLTVKYDTVTRDVLLGECYQRIFEYGGQLYSIAKRGVLEKAPDPANPWLPCKDAPSTSLYEPFHNTAWILANTPTRLWVHDAKPAGQIGYVSPGAAFLASSEFAKHPRNPVPGARILSNSGERMNHVSVNVLAAAKQLEVFFWVKEDPKDRYKDIYRVVYDISNPDFQKWDVARDSTGQIMFDVVLTPKEVAAAVRAAHPGTALSRFAHPTSLGETDIFVDSDGKKYLFFSYAKSAKRGHEGEGEITAVRLIDKHQITHVGTQDQGDIDSASKGMRVHTKGTL